MPCWIKYGNAQKIVKEQFIYELKQNPPNKKLDQLSDVARPVCLMAINYWKKKAVILHLFP